MTTHVQDGDVIHADRILLELHGPTVILLALERTLLNFLQRLCGIASTTNQYVRALDNTAISVLDTRKTTPLLRPLDIAVVAGGGVNHRYNLTDMVLLKENHLSVLDEMGKLDDFPQTCRAFKAKHPGVNIEIEIETGKAAPN